MPNRFKTLARSLIVLLAFSGLGIAQSSPSAESSADKTPPMISEPKIINGQPVFRVGHGVTPPKLKFSPQPEYSKEARKAKYQGVSVLSLIVGADGTPRDIKIVRPLGKGLDEKAIDAVKKWKFEPARKDGQPVAVLISVEVNFRLY